jgi:hypothetical protein
MFVIAIIAQCYVNQKHEREALGVLKTFLKCAQMPRCHITIKESSILDSIKISEPLQSKGYFYIFKIIRKICT